MISAVPGDVREANQDTVIPPDSGSAQAVRADPVAPAECWVPPMSRRQLVQRPPVSKERPLWPTPTTRGARPSGGGGEHRLEASGMHEPSLRRTGRAGFREPSAALSHQR